ERPFADRDPKRDAARRGLIQLPPDLPGAAALPEQSAALAIERGDVVGQVGVVLLVTPERLVEVVVLGEEDLAEGAGHEPLHLVDAVVAPAGRDEVVDVALVDALLELPRLRHRDPRRPLADHDPHEHAATLRLLRAGSSARSPGSAGTPTRR